MQRFKIGRRPSNLNWYIDRLLGYILIWSFWAMNGRAILILLFTLFVGQYSYAQKFNIKTYSVNEGLPSGNVYDVHTDDQGYLWFATSTGVVRFDGSDYKIFDTNDGLKDALVYDLYFEPDGDTWVSTEFGGLAKFDGSRYNYLPELAELDTMLINYITSVRENELWIGTDQYGIAIWDQETNEIEYINEETGLSSNQIWDIHFSSDTEVWITTMQGISVYNREEGITNTYTRQESFSGEWTYETSEDQYGRKWVATSNGVAIIQPDGTIDTITEVDGEKLDFVFSVEVDADGTIWVGTERRGLILIEPDGTTIRIKRVNGLSSNFIYRIIRDDDGTMWVATDGNGISLFKDRDFLRFDIESDLQANGVFALLKAEDGTIWISTENGISNFKNGKFEHFPIPTTMLDDVDEIWDIEELPNGNLLLLSYTYEFLEFDGNEFFYPDNYDELFETYINDIMVDEDGSIWYSAYLQLSHYKNGELTHFYPPSDEYWKLGLGFMYRDSRGMLWIGTEGGMARFLDGEFEYFDEQNGVPGNYVYEIVEDLQNNLWVGTDAGIGYIKADSIEASNIQFTSFYPDELFTRETVFLLFDSKGALWQGTNAGLNYFDMKNWDYSTMPTQIHFPLLDNGNAVELNGAAKVEDENGMLWFGTYSHGLITFEYSEGEEVIEESEPPNLYMRQILADNATIYDQTMPMDTMEDLTIEHSSNDVTFLFNAFDYRQPFDIEIRYRLSGYDSEWNYSDNFNELRYTNLPPGKYSLEMATKSIRSNWSETQEIATFRIQKPFYLTIPFFASIAVFFSAIVFIYINYRLNHIEKRELQKLVDKQTEDLSIALSEKEVLIKEIHHRVKNNLAVVSGLLELQGFQMPAGSAKMAIHESKMRVIAMSKIHENLYQNEDLAHVDFKKFLGELIKSIQATMNSVERNVEVVQYMDAVHLDVNIGIPLGLITNELISNSYKHAFKNKQDGTITIQFKELESTYELVISDDGIGAADDILTKNRKSLGITLIKSLTAQVSGKLEYQNHVGSTFRLEVPKDQTRKDIIL